MPSQIYTRRGDRGETSLADESRIPKDAVRVEAYGTVDEANSWIGAARAHVDEPRLDRALAFAQHRFYNCSSNLATPAGAPNPPRIAEADIEFLEQAIDRFEEATGPLHRFIVPGGGRAAAFLHVARTVCRRAERALVRLNRESPVDPLVQKFINRSSDFLFAAARYANFLEGRGDVFWNREEEIPPRTAGF